MDERRPFLDTIFERPDDPGPRQVFADWLEERGEPCAAWLRLQLQAWRLALEISPDLRRPGDIWRERDRLYRADPSGQLVRVWGCAAVRCQPMGGGHRLGELLSDRRDHVVLAVAELAACGVLPRAERERARASLAERYVAAGAHFLSSGARAFYAAALDQGDRAAEESAHLAAANGTVTRVEANAWLAAVARRLRDLPIPPPVTDPE